MSPLERTFVWTGATLFGVSLTIAAWTYVQRFGVSTPFQGWTPVTIDALLVAVFAAHHSLFARGRVKALLARAIPQHLLRSVYVWVASLLLAGVCLLWRPIGGEIHRVEGLARWALLVLQLTGLGVSIASVRAIRALELAGVQAPSPAEPLQIRGPYATVRHPLYLGGILVVFGTTHLTGDRLVFAVLTTVYVLMAIPWEERSLAQAFGADYARYKATVRWRLFPYLY